MYGCVRRHAGLAVQQCLQLSRRQEAGWPHPCVVHQLVTNGVPMTISDNFLDVSNTTWNGSAA